MKDTITDVNKIKIDMGIEPRQFIDVLGLAGDTSDNIPGVQGSRTQNCHKAYCQVWFH